MSGLSWHQIAISVVRQSDRRPYLLLCLWTLAICLCAVLVPRLFDEGVTDIRISGADNSPALRAAEVVWEYFPPSRPHHSPNGSRNGSHNDSNGSGSHFILDPESAFLYVESHDDLTDGSSVLLQEITNRTMRRYPHRTSGFWLLQREPTLAQIFVSADRRASFIAIYPAFDIGQNLLDFVGELRRDEMFKSLWLGAAGEAVITAEAANAAAVDMGRCDLVVLPIALAVLAWMLSSWRFLAIPVINFVASTIISFAILYVLIVTLKLHVVVMAPVLMSTMLLALGVDYSLFLLSRLVEEIDAHRPWLEAIEISLCASGHTIFGSGTTLVVCFSSLALFPVPALASLGYATAIAVVCTMVTNLFFTPTLLLCAPGFFKVGRRSTCSPCRGRARSMEATWTFRLAQYTTHPFVTGIVLVSAAAVVWGMLPMVCQLKGQGELSQLLPTGALSKETIDYALDKFPKGLIQPYFAVLIPGVTWTKSTKRHATIFDITFWHESQSVLTRVSRLFPSDGASSILSPMLMLGSGSSPLQFLDGEQQRILFQSCHRSLNFSDLPRPGVPCSNNDHCCEPGGGCCIKALESALHNLPLNISHHEIVSFATEIQSVLAQTVNANGTAVKAMVVADLAPGSAEGCDFARAAREALIMDGGVGLLGGGDASFADIIDSISQGTPPIMATTAVVILVFIGFLYRSVLIALRAIVTIGLTLIITLALVVAIYQDGILNGIGGPWTPTGGVICVLPPLAVAVVLGLALDYDVFLIGRIVEFHDHGFEDKDAITHGVWKSGRVITAAGLVMAVTFSGLIMSAIPALNVLGTLLVVAVLLDTFVMRPLVTPALMAQLGQLNWFPRKPSRPFTIVGSTEAQHSSSLISLQPTL